MSFGMCLYGIMPFVPPRCLGAFHIDTRVRWTPVIPATAVGPPRAEMMRLAGSMLNGVANSATSINTLCSEFGYSRSAAGQIDSLVMSKSLPISTPLNDWLQAALEASGLSQAALAEQLDARVAKRIDRSTINKMALGKRVVSAEELLHISEITGFPLPQSAAAAPTIAIAGKVGAGAQVPVFDAYEKGDGPQVEAPPGLPTTGIVAVEIVGDSMEPIYSAGDILFYSRETADGVPNEAIGHRCVCEDEAGMGWVKQIKRGDEPGLFHLISLNPGAETIWNVRLKWAARVRLHWPEELAKKV